MRLKAGSVVLFMVHGAGPFPVDMLRYDQCYPADSVAAGALVRDDMPGARTVALRHTLTATAPWQPTEARWLSFGWRVIGCEVC